jgi:transcriptional regulator with XRE-family HTH domain
VPNPVDLETKTALAAMGGNLRRARLKKGLTQQQAAELLGTSDKYVARVERGLTNIGVGTLLRFAKCYGVDPDKLLKGGKPIETKAGRPKKQ